ncbi:MAG: hypothetical protein BWY82_00228 [Verrucomicrobia bacterium ADurb.Bin474]|nr:MAG: hypothetical protein BWY82_00228 [Verrucomicrobia bacterium ADurb.Bin474]
MRVIRRPKNGIDPRMGMVVRLGPSRPCMNPQNLRSATTVRPAMLMTTIINARPKPAPIANCIQSMSGASCYAVAVDVDSGL